MARVFLDTNFLLIPGTQKIDIFTHIKEAVPGPVEFCILQKTMEELLTIAENPHTSITDRNAAKLAILLIKQQSLKMVKGFGKTADDLLIEKTAKGDYVATQDKVLKCRLHEKGVRVLVLRKKQRITEE